MRYLILVLLLISKTVTADCFIVSELMTKWQSGLDALGIPVGEFKDKEFRITIGEDKASVSPGKWNCIIVGKNVVNCGENVKLVKLNDKEIEQLTSGDEN